EEKQGKGVDRDFEPKAFLDYARHKGQMVDALMQYKRDGAAQGARRKMAVGIGEQQPIAAGLRDSSMQGVNFAQPSRGQSLAMDGADPRVVVRQPVDDF